MRSAVALFRSAPWPRAVVLALIAVGAAGCSAETSRFADNPFGSKPQSEATGSVSKTPANRVDTQQLPPPPVASRPGTVAVGGGSAGGGQGMASYNPSSAQQPTGEITGSVAPPARQPAPSGHWTWDGGTAVTVAAGDTIDTIAHRYGVPASAIMQANNIASPASLRVGQRLVIPRYSQGAAPAAPIAATPATRAVPAGGGAVAANANSGVHVVAPGETLTKIARLYGKSLTDVAKANNIPPHTKVNIGDRIVIPGVRQSAIKSKGAPAVAQAPAQPNAPAATPSASVVTPAAETPPPVGSVKAADAAPSFRWPVRGRVITGFGPKPNGQQNDGINLAVPEGTPVKAAEDGVVAYAGNELKGYGNLVLVRHSNGYVTAYAHAKELLVKRGDQIKRGQVIARSGQTGNVNAPQLHFEIRKGPAPVDPMQFLSGA